jgi:hypothetical protein
MSTEVRFEYRWVDEDGKTRTQPINAGEFEQFLIEREGLPDPYGEADDEDDDEHV